MSMDASGTKQPPGGAGLSPKGFAAGAAILAVLFAAVLIWLAVKTGAKDSGLVASSTWPVLVWAGLCMVACSILAGSSLARSGGGVLSPEEKTRFRLLTLGALLGFFTAVLGLLLPFTAYASIFTGGLKEWRSNPGALTWTAVSLFGGLTLMFASMQLARGLERTNSNLRRLLFGYNAVLGSLLLIAVLALLNVLAYTNVGPFKFFKATFDWTSSRMYTLNDKSRNTLADLKQPVKVYALMYQEDRLTDQIETLLNNCKAVDPEFTWTTLSPSRNAFEIRELLQKYPISDPYGLLVIYGQTGSESWDFIKYDDLASNPGMNMRGPPSDKFIFKGENALMKSIVYLREGKTHAVIYFTQGNGEMDFNDNGNAGRGAVAPDSGLGTLIERIRKGGNYEVKELKLGAGGQDKVPADAEVVVVARPGGNGVPMSDDAVKALREYVNGTASGKKGKLMVLLDVITRKDGGMVKTGLEGLMQEFGVRVADDRVLALRLPQPTNLLVTVNPRSTNPVVRGFLGSGQLPTFLFEDARTVEPMNPGGQGPYATETLIQTIRELYCCSLKDLAVSPMAYAADLRKNIAKLRDTISDVPISLAVTVAENKAPKQPMMPPGHPPMNTDSVPRMIVFGDAKWINNQNVADARVSNLELFLNCVTWLRERPDIGQFVPDAERQEYTLTLPPEEGSGLRLQLLPGFLMLLFVVGLAGGVWVVRRR